MICWLSLGESFLLKEKPSQFKRKDSAVWRTQGHISMSDVAFLRKRQAGPDYKPRSFTRKAKLKPEDQERHFLSWLCSVTGLTGSESNIWKIMTWLRKYSVHVCMHVVHKNTRDFTSVRKKMKHMRSTSCWVEKEPTHTHTDGWDQTESWINWSYAAGETKHLMGLMGERWGKSFHF